LPRRQLEAVSHLSLGSSDHIALELPGNPLGLSRDDVFIEQSSDARTALLSANLGGSSLCLVDVGGGFGRDLAAQGDAAMRAFAVDWLVKLFGSDVAAAVKTTSTTNWNAAPFVLGAMSATAPGGGTARHVLAEPLGALFLAGEAVHDTAFGTIGGAWDSGERAADAALKRLGPVKESEPPKPARTARRTHPKPQPVPGPSSLLWPHG